MASQDAGERPPRDEVPTGVGRGKRSRWRWLIWPVLIVGVSLGLAYSLQWWRERMLSEAEQELQNGNALRALSLTDFFLEQHPGHGRAQALKARVCCALGRPEESVTLYEQVGAATTDDMHAWAQAYLMLQSWSRAMRLLEQVLRVEPDHVDALYELTTCRLRMELLEDALDSAGRFARLPGQEARGAVLQANIHNDLGNAQEALQAYRRVVELTPGGEGLQISPEEFFLQFGTVLVNQGKAAEAIPYLEKCVARGPNPAAMYFLGNAFSQLGQTDKAEQAWQKAVEIDPASVSAREALGNLAMTKGDLDTALKWLDPLQAVAEKRADTAYLLQRLYALRKDEAAFKHWQERATQLREREQLANALDSMVQGAPYSFWANVVRAHRFAENGNWRQAEDMLDALVSGAPDGQFVVELKEAVRNRTPLPSLDRIPLKRF